MFGSRFPKGGLRVGGMFAFFAWYRCARLQLTAVSGAAFKGRLTTNYI